MCSVVGTLMLKPASPSRSPALHAPHQQRVAPPRRRRPWRVASPASRPCGPATPLDTNARPPRRVETEQLVQQPRCIARPRRLGHEGPDQHRSIRRTGSCPRPTTMAGAAAIPHDRTPTVRQSTASASLRSRFARTAAPLMYSVTVTLMLTPASPRRSPAPAPTASATARPKRPRCPSARPLPLLALAVPHRLPCHRPARTVPTQNPTSCPAAHPHRRRGRVLPYTLPQTPPIPLRAHLPTAPLP